MRFTTKSLLLVSGLLAIVLAAGRFLWIHWPDQTWSVVVGLVVWAGIAVAAMMCLKRDLPRNLSSTLLAIGAGLMWMVAFAYSPSLFWLFVGFVLGAYATMLTKQYSDAALEWLGFETNP